MTVFRIDMDEKDCSNCVIGMYIQIFFYDKFQNDAKCGFCSVCKEALREYKKNEKEEVRKNDH